MSKNISEIIGASMSKIRDMVDANTVVGSPIPAAEDVTLIPISKISFALASGGTDKQAKTGDASGMLGGAGCGVKIIPVAMIVIQGEHVRMLPIGEPASSAAERMVEQIPRLIDKLTELVSGHSLSEI